MEEQILKLIEEYLNDRNDYYDGIVDGLLIALKIIQGQSKGKN